MEALSSCAKISECGNPTAALCLAPWETCLDCSGQRERQGSCCCGLEGFFRPSPNFHPLSWNLISKLHTQISHCYFVFRHVHFNSTFGIPLFLGNSFPSCLLLFRSMYLPQMCQLALSWSSSVCISVILWVLEMSKYWNVRYELFLSLFVKKQICQNKLTNLAIFPILQPNYLFRYSCNKLHSPPILYRSVLRNTYIYLKIKLLRWNGVNTSKWANLHGKAWPDGRKTKQL